ncbi:hypothetical protein DFH06DRAFT_110688 [Mycena polygramma]|nr:hypothetical protein DFH06DRAFT_110688 [Mycena polygramma]
MHVMVVLLTAGFCAAQRRTHFRHGQARRVKTNPTTAAPLLDALVCTPSSAPSYTLSSTLLLSVILTAPRAISSFLKAACTYAPRVSHLRPVPSSQPPPPPCSLHLPLCARARLHLCLLYYRAASPTNSNIVGVCVTGTSAAQSPCCRCLGSASRREGGGDDFR